MPKKHIDALLRSKILVAVVAGLLFVLGLAQIAQGFIDTRDYREQIVQVIRTATGKEVAIKGNVSVSLLPVPTIYVPGVELRGDPATPIITVEMVSVTASFLSMFSDSPEITSVALQHPVLEIERDKGNVIHWDWLNSALLNTLLHPQGGASPVSVAISDGRIVYRNNHTERDITLDAINAKGSSQEGTRGALVLAGHELSFSLLPGAGGQVTLKIFADDKNFLQWQGNAELASDTPKLHGTFNLEIENLLAWTRPKVEEKHGMFEQITNVSSPKIEDKTLLPLKLTADWAQENWNIDLTNVQLNGVNSVGSGKLGLKWDAIPIVSADMDFTTLDYNQWARWAATAFADKSSIATFAVYPAGDGQAENPLPKELGVAFNLSAKQLLFGTQTWTNAKISAVLEEAALTVHQFGIELPGGSTLTMFGIVSQGSAKGLRFEGSMETQGKSLRQMLTVFDESASDLPETGLGEFYGRSNLFVSAEQVRLSEADVKIGDLKLGGGLVAYYDANPRLEADVKLKGINFDYFRDEWRAKHKSDSKQDFFLKIDKSMNFSWLSKLKTNIDFKINVDGFTFLDRKGDSASFRLFAKEGEFGIYDVRLYYPTETMEASFQLDAKGEQPSVNVLFNASELDTDYFSREPNAKAPAASPPPSATEKKVWSEELINMGWMEGLNGVFDISIGKLKHGDFSADHVKMRATLDNNLLTFQNLSYLYWGGEWKVNGSVFGGKVPGVSISFTLYNADLEEILKSLSGRENVTGKVSVSGTVTTSGVNELSWISQADSKLVLAGRGVNVQGLNLQGVVDAVTVSRTASDVFTNVSLILPDGATEFIVDGNINIKNGAVKTPGITLKTGTITGNLTGEVQLVPWTMELSTFFQFPAMTSETVPTMTVQLAGPVGSPQLQTDTASLEAYVAKRITTR